MNNPAFHIRDTRWSQDVRALRRIRQLVFIDEQHVAPALEWDGLDEAHAHMLAETADNAAIGCARIVTPNHIGRMAVLPQWRGCGVGGALLQYALNTLRQAQQTTAELDAQTRATAFYRRFGFKAVGDPFLDANIPHIHMTLVL